MNGTKNNRNLRRHVRRLSVLARAEWSTLVTVIVGALIYVVGVMSFTAPFKFPDSGVTGIALLANYSTGISPAIIVGVANILLLAWAWKELPIRVVLWTVFGAIYVALLMQLLQGMPYVDTKERLLIAVIGGAIKGFGGGMVLRSGASLGGLDIVVLYLRKRYGIEVGTYSFYINMCILLVGSFIVGIENAMFGLIGVYASSVTTDSVISSFDRRRLVFVISSHTGPVIQFIIKELGRSATLIEARGGYSGGDRPVLMCVLTRRQAVDLKRFLAETQPMAFMVVSEANEVVGKGFKTWKAS